MSSPRVAVLGFLPWIDPAREVAVRENPAAIAAARAAVTLISSGIPAAYVPVEVSGAGIDRALAAVRAYGAAVVVALGQTRTEGRVERWGRAPGAWRPEEPGEATPWLLAPDAEALAARLDMLRLPASATLPVRASDDAGGYYCDHLCVELVREGRRSGLVARFLHVTSIDGSLPAVREARLAEYAAQAVATVEWLTVEWLMGRRDA